MSAIEDGQPLTLLTPSRKSRICEIVDLWPVKDSRHPVFGPCAIAEFFNVADKWCTMDDVCVLAISMCSGIYTNPICGRDWLHLKVNPFAVWIVVIRVESSLSFSRWDMLFRVSSFVGKCFDQSSQMLYREVFSCFQNILLIGNKFFCCYRNLSIRFPLWDFMNNLIF